MALESKIVRETSVAWLAEAVYFYTIALFITLISIKINKYDSRINGVYLDNNDNTQVNMK